jgi:hypothetical protein
MIGTHEAVYQNDIRGICSTCDHVAACHLNSNNEMPVFFCEEFSCSSCGSPHGRAEILAVAGTYEGGKAIRKPDRARLAYIGLCRDCANLATCKFLKPGGGTWQCDSYEKSPSR